MAEAAKKTFGEVEVAITSAFDALRALVWQGGPSRRWWRSGSGRAARKSVV